MKATVRQIDQVCVVDLSGKITIGEGAIVLRKKIRELLESGQRHILLNLEGVAYLDSSGIGELVAGYKCADEKGGAVKLLNPSHRVCDLLQVTRLDEVFATFRDEKEALASFQ
jgi:anti-sigma B factor antagonist